MTGTPGAVAGSDAFSRLAERFETVFARGVDAPLADSEFNALALEAFAHQFGTSALYRRFCLGRGSDPRAVERWIDVPPVPATAFKHVDIVSVGPGHPPEAVFRTSGTTRGRGARGTHAVARLSLYRASLLPNFRANLLPEGPGLPLLSLVPSPSELPDSSLSTMIGMVAEELCGEARWLVDGSGRLDLDGFLRGADAVRSSGRPALLVGTAFSFVHLLDALAERGVRLCLPDGTRIMETGGFKGLSRALERDALYAALEEGLGVPSERVVNEYGMTELLSQLYEPVLREGAGKVRRHVPPPWLKVRALDPLTLAPVPNGAPGILSFFDLANLGSVCHILTEDVGTVSPDGLILRGRGAGAEPRGCSRAMEELMRAAEEGR